MGLFNAIHDINEQTNKCVYKVMQQATMFATLPL